MLLLGCGNGTGNPNDYEYEDPETRTWPAAGITRLEVTTINGAITVDTDGTDPITADITRRCTGTDQADAEAHIDDIVITESTSGDTLTLEASMPIDGTARNYSADFEVSAPELEQLDLQTTNGSITVLTHEGDVASTVTNGSIDVDMADVGTGTVALTTSNGTITLSIPSDTSATFDAQVSNGEVHVSGIDSTTLTTDETNHKAGTFGSGDAEITLSVSNGDITIQAG
jgi:hypothetical protein